jgi:aerobic-type carbon monoxide dehydrogenase small subunit (CoxS/CutS family)
MASVALDVNGRRRTFDVDPETPLLWVLRDTLGLLGTKYGCGRGLCGACTVHLDGEAVRSCSTTIAAARGRRVVTIEGFAVDPQHPILRAWLAEQVPQCGYCQPGQIMQAAAFLARNRRPSDADIDAVMSMVLCRCGTYRRVRRAIQRVVAEGYPVEPSAPPPRGERR